MNLFAALAPSTKIDELYYHMLLPSRIVTDGGLHFYHSPFESAILPHMAYQIIASPLHALGLPDAVNVTSWALSLMLAWFGWHLLGHSHDVSDLGYWCLVAILVGPHPAVNYVTGGSHAFGELAMATAVVMIALRGDLLLEVRPSVFATGLSISCCAAAVSKLTIWPASLFLLSVGTLGCWRKATDVSEKLRVILGAIVPWLLFVLPLAIWTQMHSGSPFGPVLAGRFGKSVYARESIVAMRPASGGSMFQFVRDSLISYSPIIWIAAAALVACKWAPRETRILCALLLLGQAAIIYAALPYDLRFLGGIQYGTLILFALLAATKLNGALPRWAAVSLILLCTAPWFALQMLYSRQFVPIVCGIETPSDFYRKYVAFYDDFHRLNEQLPSDSVLLVPNFRIPSVYAPRAVVYDSADIPRNRQVFLFSGSVSKAGDIPPGYVPVRQVYFNATARTETYRTPGRPANIGTLYVTMLRREP